MLSIDVIRDNLSVIGKRYGIKRIFLFGSYAKGSADENSDVDLLIEKGTPLSLVGLSGFRQDVEDALNLPVDVITTAGIESDFMQAISGTEILMYEE